MPGARYLISAFQSPALLKYEIVSLSCKFHVTMKWDAHGPSHIERLVIISVAIHTSSH